LSCMYNWTTVQGQDIFLHALRCLSMHIVEILMYDFIIY
jgi:hypothetical protein